MKINFLTLFPNYYKPFVSESIIKKALDKQKIEIDIINFRNFAKSKHKKVDDEVYGGGQGMLLKIEPIYEALKSINGKRILLSPQGKNFNQEIARNLSKEKAIVLIAGHYEGFDERVREIVDEEISIGDYILTNGELPSMVVADAIIRLIPGVINKESHLNDSFENNLLDYPQYTRPQEYKGLKVPKVLLSGNHQKIDEWRKKKALEKTKKNKKYLLQKGVKNEK